MNILKNRASLIFEYEVRMRRANILVPDRLSRQLKSLLSFFTIRLSEPKIIGLDISIC